jgi:hypothetical protein
MTADLDGDVAPIPIQNVERVVVYIIYGSNLKKDSSLFSPAGPRLET